ASDRTEGWHLGIDNKGILRFQTAGHDDVASGTVSSKTGVIHANTWQHVSAVVRRGKNETRLYVNGYLVAKGSIGTAQFDDPRSDLQLGGGLSAMRFKGELAD